MNGSAISSAAEMMYRVLDHTICTGLSLAWPDTGHLTLGTVATGISQHASDVNKGLAQAD